MKQHIICGSPSQELHNSCHITGPPCPTRPLLPHCKRLMLPLQVQGMAAPSERTWLLGAVQVAAHAGRATGGAHGLQPGRPCGRPDPGAPSQGAAPWVNLPLCQRGSACSSANSRQSGASDLASHCSQPGWVANTDLQHPCWCQEQRLTPPSAAGSHMTASAAGSRRRDVGTGSGGYPGGWHQRGGHAPATVGWPSSPPQPPLLHPCRRCHCHLTPQH